MELWRDIEGYEGRYQVSNLGRVRGLDRYVTYKSGINIGKKQFIKGRILSICLNKRLNVYEVYLSKNDKRKAMKIHRLVASAFIHNPDPKNKTTVNHIDGDRSNNKVDNLEWSSYSENLKHAYDVLNRPVNRGKGKTRCYSINNVGEKKIYDSIAEASRHTKISETQIRRLIGNECINKNYKFYI